MINHNI